ncbi:protein wntless [Lutzomyia longipalpis]|uniref:Protein wntless n=1 Tax=Lutzomyia longipalpis TaxID=7200 RepID=A0A1B0CLT5_LUTLO|nr:protein wntless [Lutzomyia longipalpis]XP_055690437.1 protein wntless [Lutzomyia longipalpis]
MSGAVIENLSGRKLTVVVSCLLLAQLVCFLIGGLIAPLPSSVQTILTTVCQDDDMAFNDTSKWFWTRGENACTMQSSIGENVNLRSNPRAVLVFQMPLPRGNRPLDFSRWQQSLIGMLHLDVKLTPDAPVFPSGTVPLTLDARLAYSNKNAPGWHLLAASTEQRHLECEQTAPQMFACHPVALFELGSLHHDYYLLNIRLPVDSERKLNLHVDQVSEVTLTAIYQNGGFTKVWLSLKCIFAPTIAALVIWFWHRVHQLQRKPVLLEWMLLALAGALTLLNIPVELLSLFVDMPFMLLLADIRQGIFYATLLSFWLVFAGEHMMIQTESQKSSLKTYWRHLSAVVVSCVSLFAFDLCERGIKLRNPFYSVWTSPFSANIASGFITVAAISAAVYFLFLCFVVYRVMRNIGAKRSSLSSMSAARRLRYSGIIYRFQFLMLATLVCAAMTVVGFVMGQVDETQLKWSESSTIEINSAFLTGVYGMWNVYIMALLALYAPSHKNLHVEERTANGEEIEFSNFPAESNPSEISSLTSFSRKAAFD